MGFEESKNKLKEVLTKNKFKIVRDNKKSLVVYNKLTFTDDLIKFEENDINEFGQFLEKKEDYHKFGEFGFCKSDYCEHKIAQIASRNRPIFALRRKFGEKITFGTETDKETFIKIGSCTKEFIFYFFLNGTEDELFYRMFRNPTFDKNPCTLSKVLSRFLTIQVKNINATDIGNIKKIANQLINSSLFELSLIKDIHLKLDEPRTRDLFRFRRDIIDKELEVPKIKYNEDIIKHYTMGLEGSHPVLSFLSFYQVLEGYFIKASNSELIKNTQKFLIDPRFNLKQDSVVLGLINDIQTFKLENNELNQLKIVLTNYIDKNKTIDFIKIFETKKGEKHFSAKRLIFDENLRLNLDEDNLISSLAKRIYTIRCAIVHSKIGHSNVKYVPSSKNDKILMLETPLMRFLAEEVIINSSIKI